MFLLRKIMGDSMVPSLRPGTVVVGLRSRRINKGDVVIFRHEGLDKIKRVSDVADGKIFLTGDNYLQSTDSRDFGWLDMSAVLARVVWPSLARRDYDY